MSKWAISRMGLRMKISEAIVKLTQYQKEVGDVEFVVLTDLDGGFVVEHGRNCEIVELPNEDETGFETVVAFLEPMEEIEDRKLKAVE